MSKVTSQTIHVVSISSGKDSDATLKLAINRCPPGSVVPIICDTDNEHEAVWEHVAYLEDLHGIEVTRMKADFASWFPGKRRFISRDQRTRREYDTIPVFDKDGNPVWARDGFGRLRFTIKDKNRPPYCALIQKTKKVGGGRKVRWTNKAKRRALAGLHPTGNAFLDLCMLKGRFPSRKAQFCTEELKRNMAVAFQLELIDQGYNVVSWQGVRRDESEARKNAKKIERIGPKLWAFRPIVDWTAKDCFDYIASHGAQSNPLYLQGMSRVGCMPCINAGKNEIREISVRFPEHLERIEAWEQKVSQCSKRGFSTFFHKVDDLTGSAASIFARSKIEQVIQWSRTSRGGRQTNMFADFIDPEACASSYGLCG